MAANERGSWWTALIVGFGTGAVAMHWVVAHTNPPQNNFQTTQPEAAAADENIGECAVALPAPLPRHEATWLAAPDDEPFISPMPVRSPTRTLTLDRTQLPIPVEFEEITEPNKTKSKSPTSDSQEGRLNRAIVDRELQHLSEQDREIWKEGLKDVSPEAATNILQMWKHSGQTGRPSPFPGLPNPAPATPQPPAYYPEEVAPSVVPQVSTRQQLCTRLRTLSQHNIANAQTFGFKKLEPMLCDEPFVADNTIADSTVRWCGTRLSTEQGELTATNRNLDIAIKGDGFLQAVNPENPEETALTRDGRLRLDAERRLTFVASGWRVVPEIVLPADAGKIVINESGVIAAVSEQDEAVELGRLALFFVLDSTSLEPLGRGLLRATPAAGKPLPLLKSHVVQGSLETSNVDVEEEVHRLRTWPILYGDDE